MKRIILFIILLSSFVLPQHTLKIGIGGGYLPDLSKVRYPFSQKMAFYGSGLVEMEMYWKSFGISIDAEVTTESTTSIFGNIKIANGRWDGARKYAIVCMAGTLNKEGKSTFVLGLGADVRASWLIKGIEELKNIDLQARVYLPMAMFSSSNLSNDVCARIGVYWRFWKL